MAAPKGNKFSPGRPSLYDESYPQRLIDYFNREPGTEEKVRNSKGQVQIVWTPTEFPTLAGFAVELGVCTDTLHEWAHGRNERGELKHPCFSEAYKKAKDFQEKIIVVNALRGGYNPAFSIFAAKNILKWKDVQGIEHGGKVDIGEITVNIVDSAGKSK